MTQPMTSHNPKRMARAGMTWHEKIIVVDDRSQTQGMLKRHSGTFSSDAYSFLSLLALKAFRLLRLEKGALEQKNA